MKNLTIIPLILIFILSCAPEKDKLDRGLSDIKDAKVLQYAIEGKILYENYCGNCHQNNGTGLGKLIPPLKGSDYIGNNPKRTARIIKYGLAGPIVVNGVTYNQPMPANPNLTNMEIAHIVTYIFNIWGNEEGVIDGKKVAEYLNSDE